MLGVKFNQEGSVSIMRIEGRFCSIRAEDARRVVASKDISGGMLVDLSATWVDGTGEAVLSWLGNIGCSFVAGNEFSSYVCEDLDLPLATEAAAGI